jgi:lysophospholipase L1-like esterase
MRTSRRFFLAQSLAMLAAPRALASAGHLVLLGDSIFDNGRYTKGGPDVVAQVRSALPPGWKASLNAVDGATTRDIDAQLARLPRDASHLVLSIGGNDALATEPILRAKAGTVAEALTLLSGATKEFEAAYRKAIAACMRHDLPLAICTIYNGNFPDPK